MAAESWSPSDRLLRLWRFILDEVPAHRGLLVFLDGAGKEVLRLAQGLEDGADGFRTIIRRVLDERRPLCLERGPAEHFLRRDGRMGFHETGSVLCLPLLGPGKAPGALYVDRAPREAPFSREDLEFLLTLSGSILRCVAGRAPEPPAGRVSRSVRKEPEPGRPACGIIGRSGAVRRIQDIIERLGDSEAAVFIFGESGTGTELVARAVHESGRRGSGPFVPVNCGAIPDMLLESELFGHARGAFTGAVRDKPGLIEEAEGGTFFLDEVTDLSPLLQAKLLRVVQEKEVRRVGESRTRRVETRFVSATNKSIEEEVRAGRFREDLYYRLRVIPVEIPPLRERMEDLPLLADHFLETFSRDMGRGRAFFSSEALEMMLAYSWPGNVRELQNEVQRCLVFSPRDSALIPASSLSARVRRLAEQEDGREPGAEGAGTSGRNYFAARAGFEKAFLKRALALGGFNRTRTARDIGLSRQGLFKLLRKHNLDIEGGPAEA
jgi:transcriptional regulator with GAF, ATPase, and Fis domain